MINNRSLVSDPEGTKDSEHDPGGWMNMIGSNKKALSSGVPEASEKGEILKSCIRWKKRTRVYQR